MSILEQNNIVLTGALKNTGNTSVLHATFMLHKH